MPPFKDQLSEEQIRAVAEYVSETPAGKWPSPRRPPSGPPVPGTGAEHG